MDSALNRQVMTLQIDGLRLPEVARCHLLLRQLDARESAVDKHIVLDLSSAADIQILLKQVRIYSVTSMPSLPFPSLFLDISAAYNDRRTFSSLLPICLL